MYRWDLEKQEGCGVVPHERPTEPRVTIEWLLAKRNSLSDLPAFLGPHDIVNPQNLKKKELISANEAKNYSMLSKVHSKFEKIKGTLCDKLISWLHEN